MDLKEWLKKAFGALMGTVDCRLNCTMPTFSYGEKLNECDLECGTDPDTFYALDTYAQCPRAYMLKYLAKKPLSIPFYAKVNEVVRESISEYARGRVFREGLVDDFVCRYDKYVDEPYPIHRRGKDWKGDWKKQILPCFSNFTPDWERKGWKMTDAYCPVSLEVAGRRYKGIVDLVLKNDAGDFAIVVHDSGCVINMKEDGSLSEESEGMRQLRRLLRKAYFYGAAFEATNQEARGRIASLFLNLYKPKSKTPIVLHYQWEKAELEEALLWAKQMAESVQRSTETRKWPSVVVERQNADGELKEDKDYCRERCPNCLSCRWAGWHPEEVLPFVESADIIQIPQKYVGAKISIKSDLKHEWSIYDVKGSVLLDSGKTQHETFVKTTLQRLGVATVGDLASKTIYDFAAVPACGAGKIQAILGLYFDVVWC